MNLGENIYKYRTQKNMSQGDLADALDVSRQSVSKWENNSAVPELDKLMKMAGIFGISLDTLVSGIPAEPPKTESTFSSPPISEPVPERRGLSPQQILGIVLLAFGGLCLIVFTVVGIFIGAELMGLTISVPILSCGLICLLCKKNIGLKCAWAVFLCLWLLATVFMTR